ncbi:MAG: M20/M25/M40 family metallo-hydrolase [Chitinophagaceae bacterium]|nr:M20/M25/M40 family metallo-hydrolase [Chitinophagaceae bacterium]
MKKILILLSFIAAGYILVAQTNVENIINVSEVTRIQKILSSDDMLGRMVNTPGIEKAASFIAGEFKKAGLQSLEGIKNFRQEFVMVSPRFLGLKASLNGAELDDKKVIVITSQPSIKATDKDGYLKVRISEGANLFKEASNYMAANKNMLVMVDESFSSSFNRLTGFKRQLFKSPNQVIFILHNDEASTWEVEAQHNIYELPMANIVSILPGKSKNDEFVIFSAHYDHVGIGKPINGDSIYNGANDDASGVTAVIMLADYYKKRNNNERTLVFVAFTAEESGGFGSSYFSTRINPEKVSAMFNIEMVGTESKWGRNSAFITGYDKTDMGKILEKNLRGTNFTFHPDPYPDQQLFYRSDNATLARLGVPAHTISTAKMEDEPHYHKPSDEIETLDLKNMTSIIKSIILSARSIVSGEDSPSRVNVNELR